MSAAGQARDATVCVVIACYNQAHFLSDAIGSVLAQTRPADDIIVVDDGSSDDTSVVAGKFPKVRLLRQENRGLAAARNRGCEETACDFVVFLDADDLLLPQALAEGLAQLAAHPDSAFVAGHYRYVREDGQLMAEHRQEAIDSDAYLAFLQGNWVGMVASVMFRRAAVTAVGGFNERLPAGEDYDLYLRLSAHHPVSRHGAVIADYRQHGQNMSANISLMLPTILAILRDNAPPPQDRQRRAAYRAGLKAWKAHYCEVYQASGASAQPDRNRDAKALLRHAPMPFLNGFARQAWRQLRGTLLASDGISGRLKARIGRPGFGHARFGDLGHGVRLLSEPPDTLEGYYVEAFLASVKSTLVANQKGTVLFDKRFADALDALDEIRTWNHVPFDFSSSADETYLLASLEQLAAREQQDCLLVLHCWPQIYDLAPGVQSLAEALKQGGQLLVTVPGSVLSVSSEVGAYRHFTRYALEELVRGKAWLTPQSTAYGNVLTAMGEMHGVPASDFSERELNSHDACYPLVLGMKVARSNLPAGPASCLPKRGAL